MVEERNDSQRLREFNTAIVGSPPEQVLAAFVNLLIETRPARNDNVCHLTTNPVEHAERIFLQLDERPKRGVFPLPISGAIEKVRPPKRDRVVGRVRVIKRVHANEDEVVPSKTYTYVAPLDCIARLSLGIVQLDWVAMEQRFLDSVDKLTRATAEEHKRNTLSVNLKSLADAERIVTDWYEKELASMRRGSNDKHQRAYRKELAAIEQAAPLLQRMLSYLTSPPDFDAFKSRRIIVLNFKPPVTQ